MNEPNSFGNPEFLKDLEFINDQLATGDLRWQSHPEQSLAVDEFPDLGGPGAVAGSSFNQELEQACLATGATGAAIALAGR